MIPLVVLQHIAFGKILALTPWKLNHNFAAAFWAITHCNEQRLYEHFYTVRFLILNILPHVCYTLLLLNSKYAESK